MVQGVFFLAKISSSGFRAPGPFEGLNVNFCKNPKCANFGVAETPHRKKIAAGATPQPGDYSLVTAGKGKPQSASYSAYQPQNLAKALTIFKVAYNHCLPDAKGQTPAMKLELAKGVVALEDILYFSA